MATNRVLPFKVATKYELERDAVVICSQVHDMSRAPGEDLLYCCGRISAGEIRRAESPAALMAGVLERAAAEWRRIADGGAPRD